MPTMNVSLPQALAEFVEKEVASGNYSTASEVVRDGLRMLREERAIYEEKLAILKREVQRGIDQIDAGEFSDLSLPDMWERRKDKRSGS
jgi:antitoxin ParD1/3/4